MKGQAFTVSCAEPKKQASRAWCGDVFATTLEYRLNPFAEVGTGHGRR